MGVVFRDGRIVQGTTSADTFVKVIQKIGIRRVIGVLPKLVNNDKSCFPPSASLRELNNGWFVNVHGSKKDLARFVKKLNKELNLQLKVME